MQASSSDQLVFGDVSGALSGFNRGGAQHLGAGPADYVTVVGDADSLGGHAQGGDDNLSAYGFIMGRVIGDALSMSGRAHGGADVVFAQGDAGSRGYGDALTMSGDAVGGDDDVRVGSTQNARAYGDAEVLRGLAQGGDDTVAGGTSQHGTVWLYGDAERLEGRSHGGDDVLIAPSTSSMLYGDAGFVAPGATTGADRFVITFGSFYGPSVMDFEPGKDVLDLVGFPAGSFEELAQHLVSTPSGTSIDFGIGGPVWLEGVDAAQLSERDVRLSKLTNEGVFLTEDNPFAIHGAGWYHFGTPASEAFVGHPGELDVYVRDFGLYGLTDAAQPQGYDTIDVYEMGRDTVLPLNSDVTVDADNYNTIVSRELQHAPDGEVIATSYYQDMVVDGVRTITAVPGSVVIDSFV